AYDSTVADYMHMDAFPYPGDVQHLTEPWVREPNFFPLVTVYTLAFILGVTGNALVISVLCCRRTGRCVTFPCLLSMAWADVLFLVVCVPHEIMSHVILHWGMATFRGLTFGDALREKAKRSRQIVCEGITLSCSCRNENLSLPRRLGEITEGAHSGFPSITPTVIVLGVTTDPSSNCKGGLRPRHGRVLDSRD
ncbi:hypothetical protein BaRGS_00034529, partial [Batillaria attramentaria]